MKIVNCKIPFPIDVKSVFVFLALAMITRSQAADPVIIGLADGDWELGELLYETDFDNLDDWAIQISGENPGITNANGELELDLPTLGCTASHRTGTNL